jgi:ATP-dependent Lon protease
MAMTGEVTLRGKALEIGGVKEKVLAAYRAGLREVIMPKSNEKDLRDVPQEVRDNMAFTFVSTMDEVLRLALLPKVSAVPADQAALHGDDDAHPDEIETVARPTLAENDGRNDVPARMS